jgi:Bacterial Ig-like domain
VSGTTVSVAAATASDNVGVAGGAVPTRRSESGGRADRGALHPGLDTTAVANGSHSLTAVARDAAGNTATSSPPITVTVDNADTIPSSTPTGPNATAIPSSQIDLALTTSTDDVGVAGYRIYSRRGREGATLAFYHVPIRRRSLRCRRQYLATVGDCLCEDKMTLARPSASMTYPQEVRPSGEGG